VHSTCAPLSKVIVPTHNPDSRKLTCTHTTQIWKLTWSQTKFSFLLSTVRKCPPLHLPEHVHGSCSLSNAWGSLCQLTCSQGYQLVGHDVTECGDKLKWTKPLPHCRGKYYYLLNITQGSKNTVAIIVWWQVNETYCQTMFCDASSELYFWSSITNTAELL
jgi:hypothetical protein